MFWGECGAFAPHLAPKLSPLAPDPWGAGALAASILPTGQHRLLINLFLTGKAQANHSGTFQECHPKGAFL